MSELTTSKINRQFRTLRSKCTALNSLVLGPTKPTVKVTYGRQPVSRKPPEDDETPPLAILQSLDRFGTRLHLDRAIIETMQLSKRIYEIRDVFRNIVQSAFGNPPDETKVSSRILSLTGICARMVGELAQSEADAAVEDDSAAEGHEDRIRSQAIEELYENVPPQYRHFTLVAHALTYILDTCPQHPTLLNALLEVCLSQKLIPESHTILLKLFTVAILPRPQSTCPCPLTHPAHQNFLTSLRETCTRSGYAIPNDNSIINDQTFTCILVDALSEPCPEQMYAWTSKAVAKLAHDLREHDFCGCFVPLCTGLAHVISQASHPQKKLPSKNAKHSKTLGDVYSQLQADALERLAKWTGSMLDILHKRMPTSDGMAEFRACVNFLAHTEPLHLHVSAEPATSPTTYLSDSLCCLAAFCLASIPTPAVPTNDPDLSVLENILRTAHIKSTTFDGLVSYIFPLPSFAIFRAPLSQLEDDTPTPPPTVPSMADGGAAAIDALVTPLRARGLLQCEVSLYLSALQHVEELIAAPVQTSSPSKRFSEKELYSLRVQLMDRVEDAERRCYGGVGAGAAPRPADDGQEWVWEDLVGSWVVKSPAVAKAKAIKEKDVARASKRRKLEDGRAKREPEKQSSSSKLFKSHAASSSSSTSTKKKAPPTSYGRAISRAPSPVSHDKQSIVELELSSDTEMEEPTPVPKRIRNFSSIIGDSFRKVVSLRAEREAKAKAAAQAQEKAKAKPKPRASAPARMPAAFAVPDSPASASAPAPWTPVPPRRRSNFTTVLEYSQKNAISLREERAQEAAKKAQAAAAATSSVLTKRKRPSCVNGRRSSMSSDEEDGGVELEGQGEETHVEPESSPARPAYAELSSDDAINLFAYPDSSPIKMRRRG